VRIEGGVPVSIYEGPHIWQAEWAEDGWIYFAKGAISGLVRIPESGGEPEVLTELDRQKGEVFHGGPFVLPGAKGMVFTVFVGSYDNPHLEVLSLTTRERRVVAEDGFRTFYVPSGHLVYGSGGTIYAVPFDGRRLEVTGPAAPIVSGAETDPTGRVTLFTLSPSGTLVYTKTGQGLHDRQLVWKDRNGAAEPLDLDPDRYEQVRLSPDGSQALVTLVQDRDAEIEENILTIDLERGVATQLTFDGTRNENAVFSPRGDRIAYSSNLAGQWNLFEMRADGSSPPERLRHGDNIKQPMSWSPDGRFLAYREITETENFNLWALPLDQEGGEPLPLATSPFEETDAAFSPDGQWVAYSSAESGRREIYLKRFLPEGGDEEKRQVSRDGGWQPVWSRDGSELFFRNADGTALMVADLRKGRELGRPRVLFEESDMPVPQRWAERRYDVSPDGRFLMLTEDSSRPTILNVVLNWTEELKRLAPATSQ
jgi:dipeptidyl aminopeptidase/acylaminoacyl peptidase